MSDSFDWESFDIKESTDLSEKFELPICLLSVDVRTKIILIKILNEDKVNNFFSSTEFFEYFDNEYLDDGIPGIYIAICNVHSWQDNYPDSCDWNSELVIGEMEEYKIERNG